MAKSTKDELKKRLGIVASLRLQGLHVRHIAEHVNQVLAIDDGSGRPWNISDYTVRKYVARVDAQIKHQTSSGGVSLQANKLPQPVIMFLVNFMEFVVAHYPENNEMQSQAASALSAIRKVIRAA